MEQFNLEKWLQDKSRKVVTRDGKDVEIIYTNSPVPHHPIVGFIDKSIYTWTIDGKLIYGKEEQDKNDLFFADEKEELTEFEKRIYNLINFSDPDNCPSIEEVKEETEILLDLARKEFIPKKQYEEDLGKAYKNADIVQFNRGMSEILNNPQKYFHVGDTIRLKNSNAEYTITSIFNGKYYGDGWSIDIMKAANDYELVENCNEISNNIDYSSEIIGFLKNYIKTYGCTAMNSWVKWLENKCG